MKKSLLPILAVLLLPLAACNQKTATQTAPAPTPDPHEVERQVQERLAQERAAAAQQQPVDQQQPAPQADQQPVDTTQPAQDMQAPVADTGEAPAPEPVVTPEPQEQASYQVFYNDLDPDGDWIQTDNYGYVWQPTVAEQDAGWRPYSDGHWVYTDYGWTWVSNERFGWATYHYGRWTRLRGTGWVWVPGNQWAPAWVSWRRNDNYVGWAPLPPEARMRNGLHGDVDSRYRIGAGNYLFVQVGQFRAPRMRDVVVNSSQNVTILSQTQNITNISTANTTNPNPRAERAAAINQGPGADFIAAHSGSPVQRLTLDRKFDRTGHAPAVNGNNLVVTAPALDAPPATTGPVAPTRVKQHLGRVQSVAPAGPVTAPPAGATGPATAVQIQPPAGPNAAQKAQQEQWLENQRKAQAAAAAQKQQQAQQLQNQQQQLQLQQQRQQQILNQQKAAEEARKAQLLKQEQLRKQNVTPAPTPASAAAPALAPATLQPATLQPTTPAPTPHRQLERPANPVVPTPAPAPVERVAPVHPQPAAVPTAPPAPAPRVEPTHERVAPVATPPPVERVVPPAPPVERVAPPAPPAHQPPPPPPSNNEKTVPSTTTTTTSGSGGPPPK